MEKEQEAKENDVAVIAKVLYDMHRYATETMGDMEAKGGPLSKLAVSARQYLARKFIDIVGEHLYEGCSVLTPSEFKGCDLSVTIVNLYQIASLAIQYDTEKETDRVFNAIHSLKDAGLQPSHLMGITTDIELVSSEMNVTLRDVTAIIGPIMFASYRAKIPQDYMVQYYENSKAERHAAGYTGDMDPIRRIQYICVILNNNGSMNSDVIRNCVSIAMGPNLNNLDHVKAYTREMDTSLYKHITEDFEDQQAAWQHQQNLLLEAERKITSITTEKDAQKKNPRCMVCGKESTKHCSICKRVYYCTAECQRSNWKAHKPSCKAPPETQKEER